MPAPAKSAAAKAKAAKAAEEAAVKPDDAEAPAPADEPTPAPDDNETSGETPEDVADAEDAGGEDDESNEAEDGDGEQVAETGMVDEPCRKCFPDGWPAAEADAFVNCGHGFGIRYGDQIEITRERALELGFLNNGE